jgi:hypothetical protein
MKVGRTFQVGCVGCGMVGVDGNTCTIYATLPEVVEWLRMLVTLTRRVSWVLILPCLEGVARLPICGVGLTSSIIVLGHLILMLPLPPVVFILFFL